MKVNVTSGEITLKTFNYVEPVHVLYYQECTIIVNYCGYIYIDNLKYYELQL